MFGYITPLKPELKIKDYSVFQSYYCGVCISIKNQFGNVPRALLNYDMTFLALLLDGLSNRKTSGKVIRCVAHPLKKKTIFINNDAIDYAAQMNVSLTNFKILDDINDDNSIKSKSLSLILSPYNKKFSNKIKSINDIIKSNLSVLTNLERNKNFISIDEICDPFSVIVGKILELYPGTLVNDNDYTRSLLYNFGYTLGKWIYLIDALDDLEEDMTKNKFNPINFLYNEENLSYVDLKKSIKDRIEFSILNCAYNCKDLLDNLKLTKNKDILTNIISLGMMDRYIKIINDDNKEKGSDFNESIWSFRY